MKTDSLRNTIVKKMILLVLPALVAFSSSSYAQVQTALNTRSFNSEVKVIGTSNMHDWTMKGSGLTCEAQFTVNAASILKLVSLNGLSFSIPVNNLKSSEGLLNTRAYKALKAETFTHINFKLSSAAITPQGNNRYQIRATGMLTISGQSREVTMFATSNIQPDRTVLVTGSKKIKMSEFGIKPPSFMLGTLKTGDEVTIDFALKFNEPKVSTAKN